MTRRSIATRLTMMNMLVSAAALLLACAGFFAYDQVTFREGLVNTLSAQAQIIASNSVSAMLFNDPQTASNTLSALKNSPHVESAGILTPEKHIFARYVRDGGEDMLNIPALPDDAAEGHWFRNTHLVLVRKIVSEGNLVGYVYLRADLRDIDQRLRRYALISFVVLLLALMVALLVSSVFGKSVSRPIVELAQTAQQVSRDKDYGIRARPSAESSELSVLVNSFNDMLKEIQERDRALQRAHDELEHRVSERTRELVSANRELEAFSYSVSHDLRGPLDSLNGLAYVLLARLGPKLDPENRELIEHIRSSGRRMTELIEDLLNLSRVTTSVIHVEKVDLTQIARSIFEELRRTAPGRQVEFMAPPREEAYGDAHLLRIVMENLLRNAWKYTSHHEHACIELGRIAKEGQPVYFVRDDGTGFDPRNANRLFQPFQRLHSTAEFPGNGIGLATVRRIIQRHGGEVWAEGAVEKGATFYFTLDRKQHRAVDLLS
jgi:signal transduction histidine kinase